MRYKVVPPVRDVAFLREVRAALPLVPDSVEDCCARIRDRTGCPSRDEAREYLTFCQALGLAAESDRGYHRTRTDLDDADLAERFRDAVFGAREVLAALDGESRTADEVYAEVREVVPRWERDRHADWEEVWRERIERLLEWGVAFGLVRRSEDGSLYAAS